MPPGIKYSDFFNTLGRVVDELHKIDSTVDTKARQKFERLLFNLTSIVSKDMEKL